MIAKNEAIWVMIFAPKPYRLKQCAASRRNRCFEAIFMLPCLDLISHSYTSTIIIIIIIVNKSNVINLGRFLHFWNVKIWFLI